MYPTVLAEGKSMSDFFTPNVVFTLGWVVLMFLGVLACLWFWWMEKGHGSIRTMFEMDRNKKGIHE